MDGGRGGGVGLQSAENRGEEEEACRGEGGGSRAPIAACHRGGGVRKGEEDGVRCCGESDTRPTAEVAAAQRRHGEPCGPGGL